MKAIRKNWGVAVGIIFCVSFLFVERVCSVEQLDSLRKERFSSSVYNAAGFEKLSLTYTLIELLRQKDIVDRVLDDDTALMVKIALLTQGKSREELLDIVVDREWVWRYYFEHTEDLKDITVLLEEKGFVSPFKYIRAIGKVLEPYVERYKGGLMDILSIYEIGGIIDKDAALKRKMDKLMYDIFPEGYPDEDRQFYFTLMLMKLLGMRPECSMDTEYIYIHDKDAIQMVSGDLPMGLVSGVRIPRKKQVSPLISTDGAMHYSEIFTHHLVNLAKQYLESRLPQMEENNRIIQKRLLLQAVGIRPRSARVQFHLGSFYLLQNDMTSAQRHLERAVSLKLANPSSAQTPQPHILWGVTNMYSGDYELAIQQIRVGLKMGHNLLSLEETAMAYLQLAMACGKIRKIVAPQTYANIAINLITKNLKKELDLKVFGELNNILGAANALSTGLREYQVLQGRAGGLSAVGKNQRANAIYIKTAAIWEGLFGPLPLPKRSLSKADSSVVSSL